MVGVALIPAISRGPRLTEDVPSSNCGCQDCSGVACTAREKNMDGRVRETSWNAWKSHTLYLFTFHWLERSHMATSNYKGAWEI